MSNRRVFPPNNVAFQTRVANGRSYHATPGSFLDVPIDDAQALENWAIGPLSGGTASRPVSVPGGFQLTRGQLFIDDDLNKVIIFDGLVWRDLLTATAV